MKEITEEVAKKYYAGWKNKCARMYFYLKEGLGLLNDFRYLVLGIVGISYAVKITELSVMILVFLISIPILVFVGRVWVKHFRKSLDWFGVEHATHFTKYEIELLEDILEELKHANRN